MCIFCVHLDVRVHFLQDSDAVLLCDRVGTERRGQPGGVVGVVVVHGVMLCHISPRIQVHDKVSFQSPACP